VSILIDHKRASEAMLEGLITCIKDELRKRIMAAIEPDIENALNTALRSFKATVEAYREPHNLRDVVHVLIERKEPKP
jgi:hypothetical protein